MARMALDGAAEIPQILHALDQGTVMIRFFFRRRRQPEKRIFCLKTDTFEILQYPMSRGKLTISEDSSTSPVFEIFPWVIAGGGGWGAMNVTYMVVIYMYV